MGIFLRVNYCLCFCNIKGYKLYPIKDEDIEHDGISLVDEKLGNSGIYRSIDEGVFVGNVLQNGGTGYFLSDKNSS